MQDFEYEPVKKVKENNKRKVLFFALTVIMCLGISFAVIYFIYVKQDNRDNTIVSGLVTLNFTENTPSISLDNTVPMTDERGKQNDYYAFTVKNTSKIPLNVKVGLELGNCTIDLSAVKYALYINDSEAEEGRVGDLVDSGYTLHTFNEFAVDETVYIKLVFWIDYYYETSGQTFTAKIKVTGEQYDIIYEDTALAAIKGTLGKVGGVSIMSPSDVQDNENIVEYGYSGEKANNYVTFNDEEWRIVGVFKNEAGEERVKIVRNEALKGIFPENYTVNGTTYQIKGIDGNTAYWDKKTVGESSNVWATSGLQYYLNSLKDDNNVEGYLSSLKKDASEMIDDMSLGEWTGKIGLLNPSDIKNIENKSLNEWLLATNSNVLISGEVNDSPDINVSYAVRPTLYLKSNVKITSGDGTKTLPYKLIVK